MSDSDSLDPVEGAAEIVAAYVRKNPLPAADLPRVLAEVFQALGRLASSAPEPIALEPKVPVKKSVTGQVIFCLECGKRFMSLKRHLRSEHNLTPEAYRKRWSLPETYPMVTPAYAKERSKIARGLGLGLKARPEEAPAVQAAPARRGRPRKASRQS